MTIHETFDVYLGESIRVSNGCDAALPTFGKFGCVVRLDSYRLIEGDEGWYIGRPWGSTMAIGDCEEEETRVRWEEIVKLFADGTPNRDGWTTDHGAAVAKAIAGAKARHESHCAESGSYRKVYGQEEL